MQKSSNLFTCLLLLLPYGNSFTPYISIRSSHIQTQYDWLSTTTTTLRVSIMPDGAWHQEIQQNDDDDLKKIIHDSKSYYLSKEEARPLIRIGKDDNEKIINRYGIWCAVVSLLTGPLWMIAMSIITVLNNQKFCTNIDPHCSMYDKTGKIWSKVWLSMIDSYPTLSGNINAIQQTSSNGACLYVANHASWMDIPVLCTVLDPVFKFIAKGELRTVPCIGQQLDGVSDCILVALL
jgi:Acyltransferase